MDNNSYIKSELFIVLTIIFVLLASANKIKSESEVKIIPPIIKKPEQKYQEYPPVIVMSEENSNYSFETGSAKIPDLLDQIIDNKLIPEIIELSEKHKCYVIDIKGFTDTQVIGGNYSNLDRLLISSINNGDFSKLKPGSNCDLGMMRAVSILNRLKKDERLSKITFYASTSCQSVSSNGDLAKSQTNKDDASSRRIEITLRRDIKRKFLTN